MTFRLNEWVEATTVPGCDPTCEHEWTDGPVKVSSPQRDHAPDGSFGNGRGTEASRAGMSFSTTQGAYCSRCGGWRGGLGMEPSPVAFIGHLILCLREWRRILRDDGVIFCNLGDSYNSQGGHTQVEADGRANREHRSAAKGSNIPGLKPKDLLMIPAMFAIAARADGWYLRSDIIWAKPNPMPESVTDRPTKAHEYVFLLSKQAKYFWDADGVREPHKESSLARYEYGHNVPPDPSGKIAAHATTGAFQSERMGDHINMTGRNIRTVWNIATPMYRLRDDLTAEQRAYVLQRIVAADSHSACSTRENNI